MDMVGVFFFYRAVFSSQISQNLSYHPDQSQLTKQRNQPIKTHEMSMWPSQWIAI